MENKITEIKIIYDKICDIINKLESIRKKDNGADGRDFAIESCGHRLSFDNITALGICLEIKKQLLIRRSAGD